MTIRTTRTDPPNRPQDTVTEPRVVHDPDAVPGIEDEPRRFLGLSPVQLTAGALAAVTSALAASYLGVAGTLVGAALGSIVSTVGAALYSTSFERAGRLTTTHLRLVRPAAGTQFDDPTALPPDLDARATVLADTAPADRTASGHALAGRAPSDPTGWSRVRRPGWKLLAGLAGVFFVIAVGLISLTELAIGHPVADSSGSGTTISRTITGNDGAGTTTPTPVPSVSDPATSPSPSGSAGAGTSPSPDATPSSEVAPSDSPSPQQPEPSGQPAPSDAPTQDAAPAPAATQAPPPSAPAAP